MDLISAIENVRSGDLLSRRQAAEWLALQGTDARDAAVPLVEAMADTDEMVREWVGEALENLGAPNDGDVAALIRCLQHSVEDVVYWAVTLLGRLEASAGPAVPQLARVVTDHPSMAVRQRAAWALARMGEAAIAARTALEASADSPNKRLARLAREALERLGNANL